MLSNTINKSIVVISSNWRKCDRIRGGVVKYNVKVILIMFSVIPKRISIEIFQKFQLIFPKFVTVSSSADLYSYLNRKQPQPGIRKINLKRPWGWTAAKVNGYWSPKLYTFPLLTFVYFSNFIPSPYFSRLS
jgi:hypothetical protein